MKIVYDYRIFYLQKYGGISKYFTQIFERIKKSCDAKIIAPIYLNNYIKNNSDSNIIKLFFLKNHYKYTRSLCTFFNKSAFKYYIKVIKPDIIHLTYFDREIDFNSNAKIVVTVYDLIHEIFENKYNFKYPKNFKKKYLERANHIICISNNTKRDLIKFYDIDEKKISVISLGYNETKDFKKLDYEYLNFPYLLVVGDRKNYKNFDNFLRAYAKSKKIFENINIVCFGGGPISNEENELLLELGIENKKIYFINGDDLELNYVYKKAKLYVCPSLYEGFGLTILESMNMGCPVACSNTSSLPEVGGNAVEYFDPYNVEDMSKKIEKLISSEKELNLQREKHINHLTKFSWDNTTKKTLEVYEKI